MTIAVFFLSCVRSFVLRWRFMGGTGVLNPSASTVTSLSCCFKNTPNNRYNSLNFSRSTHDQRRHMRWVVIQLFVFSSVVQWAHPCMQFVYYTLDWLDVGVATLFVLISKWELQLLETAIKPNSYFKSGNRCTDDLKKFNIIDLKDIECGWLSCRVQK